jgi:myosin-crossreactive antigen
MSYEPEGEQIDEVAPLVIGAGLAAAAAAPYLLRNLLT